MIAVRAWIRAYRARRKRRSQIREVERCLRVLCAELERLRTERAKSLDEVIERWQLVMSVAKAEALLRHLRECA